jgi:hypothetical protein
MESYSKTENRIAGIARMTVTEGDVEAVRLHVKEVIEGDVFKGSHRSGLFLQHIVEEAISGHFESLKERVIGVELFDRAPSYDTGADAIVRVTASDVRKRLLQHYDKYGTTSKFYISLPPGSYIPEILQGTPQSSNENGTVAPIVDVPAKKTRWSATVLAAFGFSAGVVATAIVAILFFALYPGGHPSPRIQKSNPGWTPELQELWAPFTSGQRALTLTFETRLFVDFRSHAIVRDSTIEDISSIESSKTLMALKRLFKTNEVYEARRYADFSAVTALFSIAKLLATTDIPMKAERSIDMTNDDIHSTNLLLLGKPGAYDAITARSLPSFNFVFQKDSSIRNINPKSGEQPTYLRTGDTAETGGLRIRYAIITMTPGSEKGQHVLNLISADSELFGPLALYITDPHYAKDLVDHLRLPSGKLPESYEVLIKIQERGVKVLQASYVAHRVI